MSRIDDLLAEEGAAAETYEIPDELPEHVAASRPNLGRPTVVSVPLPADEHGRLQQAAKKAHLPVSTVHPPSGPSERLRAEEQGGSGGVNDRLTRLERAVFHQPA